MLSPETGNPAAALYRAGKIPRLAARVERRADGTLVLSSANAIRPLPQRGFSEFLPHWARERGERAALCERDAEGAWRRLSWAGFWQQVQSVAAALLAMGLGPQRPLMLLSGNSIEQAVLLMAAEHVGVPVAPVSPAYSLRSDDFVRLKGVRDLVPPGAVFVQSANVFARALAALDGPGVPVIAVEDVAPGQHAWRDLASIELAASHSEAIDAAHRAIRPQDVARVLFTSGSTGVPKGVVTTYGALEVLVGFINGVFGELTELQPTFLDWLPWHHAFGLMVNLNRSILTGATHYIDDGRPLPGQFARTVRNLREVSPTVFNSVPVAWAMLAGELERDEALARSFFARVVGFGYGGASLQKDVWQRIQRVAVATVGERIRFHTGLASTETVGSGTFNDDVRDDLGNIGVPSPGSQVKLVPLEGGDGRYEIRTRSAAGFGGYVRRPDLSRDAVDEEGYFRIGDAVRLADPADPAKGLYFAGRVVEDFKLLNGTWVRTGALRLDLLELCAPLLADVVVCGHDRDFIGALAWPDLGACRQLAPELAGLDAAALAVHPLVVRAIAERLRAQRGSASLRVERVLLLAEPPSMDANEIADKGYVNQAATRARRAHCVDALFADPPAAHVACAG